MKPIALSLCALLAGCQQIPVMIDARPVCTVDGQAGYAVVRVDQVAVSVPMLAGDAKIVCAKMASK
jgi:hypothetical protein